MAEPPLLDGAPLRVDGHFLRSALGRRGLCHRHSSAQPQCEAAPRACACVRPALHPRRDRVPGEVPARRRVQRLRPHAAWRHTRSGLPPRVRWERHTAGARRCARGVARRCAGAAPGRRLPAAAVGTGAPSSGRLQSPVSGPLSKSLPVKNLSHALNLNQAGAGAVRKPARRLRGVRRQREPRAALWTRVPRAGRHRGPAPCPRHPGPVPGTSVPFPFG